MHVEWRVGTLTPGAAQTKNEGARESNRVSGHTVISWFYSDCKGGKEQQNRKLLDSNRVTEWSEHNIRCVWYWFGVQNEKTDLAEQSRSSLEMETHKKATELLVERVSLP